MPLMAAATRGVIMKITLPSTSSIGAVITELDASQIDATQIQALKSAVYQHKLLVLRNQSLDDAQYLAFAGKLGTPQIYLQSNYHHPQHPEIFVSSNVLENGVKVGVAGTGQYWHTDYQFAEQPLSTTLIYPKILPTSKRETYYIDMARVYASLPDTLASYVDGKRAIHEAKWRYKISAKDIDRALIDILREAEDTAPAVTHPAVIEHPVTGERSLYVSRGFTTGIQGLDARANARVLTALFDFIEREEHVHTHTWQEGDILYWDNRTLLHRASRAPRGEPCKSYRIGVYDELPFYVNTNPSTTTARTKAPLPWLTATQ
jgi:taurine dioxygenase